MDYCCSATRIDGNHSGVALYPTHTGVLFIKEKRNEITKPDRSL